MDKLITDFNNRIIVILSDSQTEMFAMEPYNQKTVLLEFFPRKSLYMRSNSFTFDYEKNVIEANEGVPFDGRTYHYDQMSVLDFAEVEDLKWKRYDIMDLLGFEVKTVDDKSEKYREYAEFIEKNGMPPQE